MFSSILPVQWGKKVCDIFLKNWNKNISAENKTKQNKTILVIKSFQWPGGGNPKFVIQNI